MIPTINPDVSPIEQVGKVAHAALLEAGRPDLAEMVIAHDELDGYGPYVEMNDDILDEADWAIVNKAEALGRQSVGLPPMERHAWPPMEVEP